MAGDLLPLPAPHHPDLTFERVTTEDQLRAYADINARAYGFPLEDGRDGLTGSTLWKDGIHAYLGVRDGTPWPAPPRRRRRDASSSSSSPPTLSGSAGATGRR